MNNRISIIVAGAALLAGLPATGPAQTPGYSIFRDNFTGASSENQWYFSNGACLTAGTGSASSPNYIPSCKSVFSSYYSQLQPGQGNDPGYADGALLGGINGKAGSAGTLPDPVGSGALRFTNANNAFPYYGEWENGSIVSVGTFNAGQGVQITFKTVTYRGDAGGAGKDGADGIAFFLIDGTKNPGNTVGNVGGSLGYSCSNINGPPFDGLIGAYLGLGIDEYGNFLHGAQLASWYTGTNTVNPAILGYSAPNGDNSQYGLGYYPYGRIGLRGAGNVAWSYLNSTYPQYYPSSLPAPTTGFNAQQAAVQLTCIRGQVQDYSQASAHGNYSTCLTANGKGTPSTATNICPNSVSNATLTAAGLPALTDYAPIPGGYAELPYSATPVLANETAVARPTGLTTNGVTSGNVFLYNLKITQTGLLSLSYSINGGAYAPVITNQSITASNGALPSQLRFGFTGATGGATNIHELLCFKAEPVLQSSSSASGDEKQTSEVQTTSQAYFAFYDPNDWTGRVTAYGLNDSSGTLTINSLATWDAQCVLTGSTNCVTTGVAGPTAPEAPSSRVMLTWNTIDSASAPGTGGIAFEWPGGGPTALTSAEQGTIDAGDATATANRVNYLRGERSNEINATTGLGLYRARDGVLGDIIDSSPTWVGPPSAPYVLTWKDNLNPGASMPENSGQNYSTFTVAEQSRLNVVYVGANDGFLHGFRSGAEDAAGNVITSATTPNDGLEVLAYMPGAILNTIHPYSATPSTETLDATLDYSNASYVHNYFVDATPGSGDLYYGAAWHTWLVGGLGLGGSAIYALDVTNPSATNFIEGNAASLVKGEWDAASITCVGNATCGNSLGYTYGTPQIRRLHNGNWGAIFGNGFGSSSGDAGIYVMVVDHSSGAVTFYYLSTSTGSAAKPNGIAYVAPADLDGDHITDYVYAGDLEGNVWRFDLTSALAQNWKVSTGPLFKTSSGQPITTQLVVSSAIVSGTVPQVIIGFGTGQRTQFTNTSSTSYASGTQSIYGVWDWNLAAWNALNSAAQYASLTGAQVAAYTKPALAAPYTLGPANLQLQSYTENGSTVTVTTTPIIWATCASSGSCTSSTPSFGWAVNLSGISVSNAPTTEQIVANPNLYESAFLVNSTIPATNAPLSCNTPSTDEGIIYAISMTTGGTFVSGGSASSPTYASAFEKYQDTQTVGLQTNETGAVTVVNTVEGTTWVIGQNIAPNVGSAPGQAQQIQLPTNTQVNRKTWVQLR